MPNPPQLKLLDLAQSPSKDHPDHITIGPARLRVSPVFRTYWSFAAERQKIFFRRLRKEFPLTEDPILREFKFTNAYRASDRVSQFLIKQVIYTGDQDINEVFFRTMIFKLFNKIETWQLLRSAMGEITLRTFSVCRYGQVLLNALLSKKRIYSAAYIMPSGGRTGGRKHVTHLELLAKMVHDNLARKLSACHSMETAFSLLRSYPMIGDFLAYQFVTDLNYSNITNFGEMDFVMPGPGARDGLRKCFPDMDMRIASDAIRHICFNQKDFFARFGVDFENLWGRPLQLIDCQNLFCEIDKYSRRAHPEIRGDSGRTRIKQLFCPNPEPLRLFYPPKWKINNKIPVQYRQG